jgi:hypothetical protein
VFTEDLTPFFNVAEFATPGVLNGAAVSGIFEAGFEDASLAGFGPAGTSPTYTLPSASVPAAPEGKVLVISTGQAAGSYRVANARHDATGVCALDLLLQR